MPRASLFDAEDRQSISAERNPLALLPAAVVVGGPDNDRLVGTAAADRLEGRGGDDTLQGLAGADELRGGAGNDKLVGNRGADQLFGRAADDQLLGGRGPDQLRGGAGADVLDGGRGHDVLTGGGGADRFRISELDGRLDRILDFDQAAGDQLDLSAFLDLGPDDLIGAFVRIEAAADGTLVAVDPSGSGSGFVDAALLVDTVLPDPEPLADPIPAAIAPSGIAVELVDLVQAPASSADMPRARLNDTFHAGDGSGRLFTADSRGTIWVISEGNLLPDPFLDASAIYGQDLILGAESGLRGFAFHPDFAAPGAAGFGKFYTSITLSVASAADSPGTPVFISPDSDRHHDVVIEWTVDPNDPDRIDPASGRELLRIEQPRANHNIGQIRFEPGTDPGDPDHGLLYAGIGDGGIGQGQDTSTLLGTIIRIDPLQNGSQAYSVPDNNPFVGEPGVLPEIWAFGLRHPQFLSWDPGGSGKLLIGDIGQGNVEEVNLGVAGANYGWHLREGTFERGGGLFELPPYDASFDLTYPVAQYDHDEGNAIAGGFVYRGTRIPELIGEYVFGDIVNGRIFHIGVEDLELGRQAPVQELSLLRDGAPITLLELVDAPRADLRFGQDEAGEIYVTTKQDGMIRTFEPVAGATLASDPEAALDALLVAPATTQA